MRIQTITDCKEWRGRRVLVRCDFNVSVTGKNRIDDYKIIRSLPTIQWLTAKGARLVLMTHFGRPGGKIVTRYTLSLIAKRLSKLLGKKVVYIHDCVGPAARRAVDKMKDGDIVLLENLRFYPEELANDKSFARALAGLGDVYVNDAFAVSHRAQASVSAIQEYLSSYAGLLLADELRNLQKVAKPRQPLVVVIGGSKLETKVPVIKNLLKQARAVLVGGMLTYDFLAAQKFSTGKYAVAAADKRTAKKMLDKKVVLPLDLVCSSSKTGRGEPRVYDSDKLPDNVFQFDIGPKTIREYARHIKQAKTIIWNGPLGMFERGHFKHGTLAVARLVASSSRGKAFGIVGGGETVAALRQVKMLDDVDWVSTSGGAMLVYLAGGKLPGLKKIVK